MEKMRLMMRMLRMMMPSTPPTELSQAQARATASQ
jgi:hypothetical protein